MKKSIFNVGDVYRSKDHPEKDFLITTVYYSKDKSDDCSDYIEWEIANHKAWDKFVANKKGYDSIESLLLDGKNTFPYPCCGECSPKSLKNKIRKFNMEFIENIKFITLKRDEKYEYWEHITESKNQRNENGFYLE